MRDLFRVFEIGALADLEYQRVAGELGSAQSFAEPGVKIIIAESSVIKLDEKAGVFTCTSPFGKTVNK